MHDWYSFYLLDGSMPFMFFAIIVSILRYRLAAQSSLLQTRYKAEFGTW